MANTIKPKRSYTLSSVPSGLAAGELAVNASATPKVWIGNAAGTGNVLIASLSLSDMAGSTTNITEGTNLYYTDARARAAVSAGTGITYSSSTGVITADAASANTASKLVIRDASGNFSAGTITANLTGTASNVTTNANLTGVITSVGNTTSIASQTGTGSKFVVDTSPTLVTPVLGVATATSINKVSITAPATSATITVADGKTFTLSNTLTFTGTDSSSVAFGTGGTVIYSGGPLGTPSSGTLTNCTFPTLNQNTTGTASNVTGIVALANGGTAANLTAINGGILYSTASAFAVTSAGTSGQLLQSNGAAAPSWVASPGVPTGSLFPYAGSAAPTGYLLCDGSAVARTGTYAALFAVIGTTYGSGDGSTTFNLPDLRGRLPLGAGTGVGLNASGTGKPSGTNQTARTAGQWGGEETNLLSTNEMPSHNHNGATANAGSHSHTLSKEVLTYVGSGGSRYDPYPGSVWTGSPAAGLTISTQADHSHTITAQGGGARHNTMPPFIVANYIIKT